MEEAYPLSESTVPRGREFRVALPAFEGPLDLLLHLIKKHELDILDLPIAFITERYLEYLRVMQELDLEMAGEYLVMAATLAHIKSKMLLPKAPEDQQDESEDGEQLDPRLELIRRLLEYQKYKEAAEHLGSRAVAGRDVFPRGMNAQDLQGPTPLAEIGLFRLLDAFQGILARAKNRLALEVTAERISIQERITQLTEMLRDRKSCQFEDLFEGDVTRYEIVVTFLALLEMCKLRVTRIYQADHRSPIHVQYALLDPDAPSIPPEPAEQAAPPADAAFTAAVVDGSPSGADEAAAAPAVGDLAADAALDPASELDHDWDAEVERELASWDDSSEPETAPSEAPLEPDQEFASSEALAADEPASAASLEPDHEFASSEAFAADEPAPDADGAHQNGIDAEPSRDAVEAQAPESHGALDAPVSQQRERGDAADEGPEQP